MFIPKLRGYSEGFWVSKTPTVSISCEWHLGGIRWWKSCCAQGLWTPATRSLGWNSGWTNWIWEQHCGLLCPTHTFASWKKASRGISLSIKWLEEKCLKLPNAVRGSVHIYADLKRCSWADGQTLPFIHPPAALSDFGDQCLSMFSLLPHIRSWIPLKSQTCLWQMLPLPLRMWNVGWLGSPMA